jgi:hypothetical protein
MQYEFYVAGSKIFNFGDAGDKFYLIIEGGVSILIPSSYRKSTLMEKEYVKSWAHQNHIRQTSEIKVEPVEPKSAGLSQVSGS